MKTAFLFPGQGAQLVSMGKDIAEAFPLAAEIFEKANEIVGFDLKKVCFEGPEQELNTTIISQPAIFTVSAAILDVIKANTSLNPDVTAGLSLGEYSALYAAGNISFEDGLKLVRKRGQAMQTAADNTDGAMVSIIGLDEEKVKQLCDEAREDQLLEGVNFNCPGQIVISGNTQACSRAAELAEKYGAIKAIKLAVAGAFHTQLVSSAADDLAGALDAAVINEPVLIKTIANVDTHYYQSAEDIKKGLINQLTSPLLWQKCMEKLIGDGVEHFYEIGPGRVLTGLMKRINRKIKVNNISSLDALNSLLK